MYLTFNFHLMTNEELRIFSRNIVDTYVIRGSQKLLLSQIMVIYTCISTQLFYRRQRLTSTKEKRNLDEGSKLNTKRNKMVERRSSDFLAKG